MRVTHPFEPIYDKNSKILILGSFPSVKSRENNFYYAHPQNRFWKVLKRVCNHQGNLITKEEKTKFLLDNNIAIWDSIKECDIENSDDSSIKNAIPNDIEILLKNSNIEKIFCNGNKSYEVFKKYHKDINAKVDVLPSTSPANARYTLDKLVDVWSKKIK